MIRDPRLIKMVNTFMGEEGIRSHYAALQVILEQYFTRREMERRGR